MNRTEELYKLFKESLKTSTDSRREVSGSIFFAISGDNFNGNAFAKEALGKGARLAVIDDERYKEDDRFFMVDNTLQALQNLALQHRINNPVPVLGITGSNGKTTTKELIAEVLGTRLNIVATEGNLNNHIGLPLTLLKIRKDTELAVVEMGANHPGEIKTLCNIARPDVGLITNIGKAHLEGFGNIEGIVAEKNKLYQYIKRHSGTLIVNADDKLLMSLSKGISRFTYGQSGAGLNGKILKSTPGLTISWRYGHQENICHTHLFGRYNFYNILAAIATGLYFKIPTIQINKAIGRFVPDNNRSQRIETAKNRIILDAYNANPVSMSEALRSFSEYGPANPWLILGDMFELGKTSLAEHENMIRLIEELGFKNVILVGSDFYRLKGKSSFTTLASTEEAAGYLKSLSIKNADILVKGSRGMQLEKLLTFL